MTLPPLADVDALSHEQAQVVALSMVYAAAQLVHLLATQGSTVLALHPAAVEALIKGLLSDDPQVRTRYHYPVGTQLGLRTLERCLTEPFSSTPAPTPWRHHHTVRYVYALLALERKLYGKPPLLAVLTKRVPVLRQRLAFFDANATHPALLAGLADLYADTAGALSQRIQVQGAEALLTDKPTVDAIRACLLAGIQAAHLWRQHGGWHWTLMFGRRKTLVHLRELAMRHYRNR